MYNVEDISPMLLRRICWCCCCCGMLYVHAFMMSGLRSSVVRTLVQCCCDSGSRGAWFLEGIQILWWRIWEWWTCSVHKSVPHMLSSHTWSIALMLLLIMTDNTNLVMLCWLWFVVVILVCFQYDQYMLYYYIIML